MKAIEQCCRMVLFIMPCKVVLTFESADEIPKLAIQMKATERIDLSWGAACHGASNVRPQVWNISNECSTEHRYISSMLFVMPLKVIWTFGSQNDIMCEDSNESLSVSFFSCDVLFITTHKVVTTFQSVNAILKFPRQSRVSQITAMCKSWLAFPTSCTISDKSSSSCKISFTWRHEQNKLTARKNSGTFYDPAAFSVFTLFLQRAPKLAGQNFVMVSSQSLKQQSSHS